MIVASVCNVFKLACLPTAGGDVFKIALYTKDATLSKATTAYSPDHEVVGPGYKAGGAVLTGLTTALAKDAAYLTFADPTWPDASITAHCALIYNKTKGHAVAVLDFEDDVTSKNGLFSVRMPKEAVRLG